MKFIADKVRDGVLDLSGMSRDKLIDLAQEAETTEDRDTLGHEIMYRG